MKNCLRLLHISILIAWLPLVAGSQVSFPLKASATKRYLIDQRNIPFPILGRTAWCIVSQPVSSYQAFIENSLSHGYNSIEMSVICHWAQSYYPPHNGQGDLPFQKRLDGLAWNGSLVYSDVNAETPDLTTPNERYWTFVDSLLAYCESKGILVFFFPAYLGAIGTNEGWMKELVANDTEKTRTYGAWIANRYKNQKNLVWMILGDRGYFNTEEKKVEAALIAGLKSVPGQQSAHYSAESGSGENSADQVDFGNQMTLNGVYSWGSVSIPALARLGYSHQPILPTFLLEEPYDEEGPDGNRFNPNAIQPVRRFQWWGWLSTIGGYISGNGYIWPFIKLHWWEKHLNSPGTFDMHKLNDFIKSVHWWDLVPSGMNGMRNLITYGGSKDSSTDYVAAAATADGTLLIAYVPPDHTGSITVDMTVLKEKVKAYWFDPTSGTLMAVSSSSFNNKGTQQFTPPGKNNSGYNDWVLKLVASDS
jgi:Protein of unknown function (DUF4038)/Putative collagen-binding domain of a collagenase